MGAEEGNQQNVGNANNINKKDNTNNKKDKKEDEESEEDDEEEESEESDDESEKNDKGKSSKKVSEQEKEIKKNLETIPQKSDESKSESEESEESDESESNKDKNKSKKESKNETKKEIKKGEKKSSVNSLELSEPSASKKSGIKKSIQKEKEKSSEEEKSNEKKSEDKISEEKPIEKKETKEINKSKNKESTKKYKNVLPGEIPEERKISKAQKLSFKYTCCQTIENAHEKEITTLCYILKRNEIATGSVDETIKIWKVSYKKGEISIYKELTGHSDSITCIRDFIKLNCFCSTSSDNTVKLWDTSSLKCIKTLKYHTKCVLSCCYNSMGRKEIFSGGEDLIIVVWTTEKNLENYEEKKALKGHTKRISSLAFADDYNYLLSGSDDKTLRIWNLKDIEDIQCIKVIKDLMCPIDLLVYLDNRLMVGCEDGVISFIKMNKMKRCRSVKFSNSPIYSFNIFHKNKYMVIGCKDGKARVWKIGTNKREVLIGHTEAVTGVCDFEDDYIITTSMDKSIKLWKKG